MAPIQGTGGIGANQDRGSVQTDTRPATSAPQTALETPKMQSAVSGEKEQAPVRLPHIPRVIPKNDLDKAAPLRESMQQILERLEPLIASQVQQVQAVLEEKGLGPADVNVMFAWDITGDEKQVCSFCGRHGCGYRPVMYQTQNVEIDLLEDAKVAAAEIATRLGVSFGEMVYDDKNALVLREIVTPSESAAAENVMSLSRFRAFRNRLQYPDPANRAWLDAQLAKWQPADATTQVTGAPDDRGMLMISQKVFAQAPGQGPKALIVAKSQVPKDGLRGQEIMLGNAGIALGGLAIGRNAAQVAQVFLKDTMVVPDLHQAREKVGERLASLIEETVP
jgi:hypothetical protein